MSLLSVVLGSAIVLFAAYRIYGGLLTRLFRLDSQATTPAVEMRDGGDYDPIEPKFLLGQHFSAIAAAGPIVGPILAGVMFGWGPALAWILIGSILIGGVHDMGALTASIRHRARSIAEVVRDHMSRRSYVLFLTFIWIALIYIIVAFTDITASSFVGRQTLENGQVVNNAGIATSSLLYLLLPVAMGLVLRFTKVSLGVATAVFLPLVALSIIVGQSVPFDLTAFGMSEASAQKAWVVLILAYCFVAALSPMWILLQPRGHLGGFFLYASLAAAGIGLLFANKGIQYPAFTGFTSAKGDALFPFLFITIACGACSGFHSLIASGTTSKQLRRETDARPIGYGAMMLEALVAVVALCTVMMLAPGAEVLKNPQPNFIYAQGIGGFLSAFGLPATLVVAFALMAFTTFVYDTLDVCTRLGRYIIQELTGWQGDRGKWVATGITAFVPMLFVLQSNVDATGKITPAWRTYWNLFGASNQLLAALALLGVTVWLWRTERARWTLLVAGLPTAFMVTMSVWALVSLILKGLAPGAPSTPVPYIGMVLLVLAALMLIEAVRAFRGPSRPAEMSPAAA